MSQYCLIEIDKSFARAFEQATHKIIISPFYLPIRSEVTLPCNVSLGLFWITRIVVTKVIITRDYFILPSPHEAFPIAG